VLLIENILIILPIITPRAKIGGLGKSQHGDHPIFFTISGNCCKSD
jgi:hypothetical protein